MLTENGNLIICADELAQGDVICHVTGELWEVYTEPQYTYKGITFEALHLEFGETQSLVFEPQQAFELVCHL